jgi:hypothetical protein
MSFVGTLDKNLLWSPVEDQHSRTIVKIHHAKIAESSRALS